MSNSDAAQQGAASIKPHTGKLGIMIPGMGAVATTFIAGVEAVRRGFAKPIGSLTQMGTIRLGKRTENRTPLVKDFVPLAPLNDLVFTGWDIFGGNLYAGFAERARLYGLGYLRRQPVRRGEDRAGAGSRPA
jgi:myo-inositol-1-phosphate synthase